MSDNLTEKQIRSYRENGFLVVDGLIDRPLIDRARTIVDDLLGSGRDDVGEREPDDPAMVRRIWSPTTRDAVFNEILEAPRLVDAVAQLIGDDVVFQYSKLNVKPPRVGSVVSWHQDFAYYPHTNTDLVAVMIHFDEATRENACLKVAAGSHHKGLLSHDVDGFFRGKIESLADAGVDESTVVDCEASPGAAIFLHPMVVHGSARNTSDRYRRAFIPAYRAADAFPVYYGPHAAHNEPNARLLRGQPSRYARSEGGRWRLPIAAAEFNSLYQVQEGSHLTAGAKSSTGYFAHEVTASVM